MFLTFPCLDGALPRQAVDQHDQNAPNPTLPRLNLALF
jgi:hypothetical protein